MRGTERFEYYLLQLEKLIQQAHVEKDPAEWLYRNNARTVTFMLEGLAKLYSNLHDKSLFSKLRDRFKVLEDVLGRIDHFDSMLKHYSNAPVAMISWFKKNKQQHIKELNKLLETEKWNSGRIDRIREKLKDAKWMTPADEITGIKKYYNKSVGKINGFYKKEGPVFNDVENQVHELRRKIRWLSIYPQALQGLVQLKDSNPDDPALAKYLQPEIVNSPFNQLPAQGNNSEVMYLEKNYFLALSWVIAELGKLKDTGLVTHAGLEAAKATHTNKDIVAGNNTDESVLSIASNVASAFFKEQNLEKMLQHINGDVSLTMPELTSAS